MREIDLLDLAAKKRVLFCGERIIDVYHYVQVMGKASKDPVISVQLLDTETFEGGVIAAKNHAASFCKVEWLAGGRVIRKERYVEKAHIRKLFEVYSGDGSNHKPLPDLSTYDAVVVLDYGHGFVDGPTFRRLIQRESRFLAVNVQTNSGNYGYNLATKYKDIHPNYLCVDEAEARLATQNRTGDIKDSLQSLAKIADKVCITLGGKGALATDGTHTARCGAFADQVVDTVGAGDAFFAVSSLIAEEADLGSILMVGNIAGAIKSQIIGHRGSVSKHELIDWLKRIPVSPEGSADERAEGRA